MRNRHALGRRRSPTANFAVSGHHLRSAAGIEYYRVSAPFPILHSATQYRNAFKSLIAQQPSALGRTLVRLADQHYMLVLHHDDALEAAGKLAQGDCVCAPNMSQRTAELLRRAHIDDDSFQCAAQPLQSALASTKGPCSLNRRTRRGSSATAANIPMAISRSHITLSFPARAWRPAWPSHV